jgi:saccharopine dehydrogenase-like NADP-dependent oxidoreductase
MAIKIAIFGGNGFVGQSIIKKLVNTYKSDSVNIISLNRSGIPKHGIFSSSNSHLSNLQWICADILKPETYRPSLENADCVISCVGTFGTNEFMEKV